MSTQILSQLECLRESVAAQLRGYGTFGPVNIVTRASGDIAKTIEDQLARAGVSIEVFIKSARPTQSQSFTVRFDPAVIGVAVYENVLINQDPATGTGLGAFYLIEQVLAALKLWTPPGSGSVLMPDSAGPQFGKSDKLPTLFILTQDFTTTVQLTPRLS
jgi:hypothetical protein